MNLMFFLYLRTSRGCTSAYMLILTFNLIVDKYILT